MGLKEFGPWSEQKSSSGRTYFYNRETEVSQWDKPQDWKDHELRLQQEEQQRLAEQQKRIQQQYSPQVQPPPPPPMMFPPFGFPPNMPPPMPGYPFSMNGNYSDMRCPPPPFPPPPFVPPPPNQFMPPMLPIPSVPPPPRTAPTSSLPVTISPMNSSPRSQGVNTNAHSSHMSSSQMSSSRVKSKNGVESPIKPHPYATPQPIETSPFRPQNQISEYANNRKPNQYQHVQNVQPSTSSYNSSSTPARYENGVSHGVTHGVQHGVSHSNMQNSQHRNMGNMGNMVPMDRDPKKRDRDKSDSPKDMPIVKKSREEEVLKQPEVVEPWARFYNAELARKKRLELNLEPDPALADLQFQSLSLERKLIDELIKVKEARAMVAIVEHEVKLAQGKIANLQVQQKEIRERSLNRREPTVIMDF